ncbi:MAG: phenylalanine--tRNA ligase subunit beta, partial [Aquificaceae bacterium]|nr:phenylalanine--tRNA ligase subunit beta [Aquificaceae bacterium]
DFMVGRGFSEVITFSFEDLELYESLSLPLPQVQVVNPLNKSQRFLRTSLLPSLLRVCIDNTRNYEYSMAIFEIGKVFLEEEETRLGFLMTGYRRLFPEEEYSPYDAVSLHQDLLRAYEQEYNSSSSDFGLLHPNHQRAFFVENELVAFFGVLNPEVQKGLSIRHRVILGEVNLNRLREKRSLYRPYSTFPPVVRDISLFMDKERDVDKLISYIKSKELVESVKVFSLYTDPRLGEGKKSVSFRLTFRSKEGTLSDERVNTLMNELLKELEEKFGARLR